MEFEYMDIKTRILTMETKRAELYKDIETLRGECKHTNLKGKYYGDTGNWCKSDDSYWVAFKCDDCGKRWSEDQKDVRYKTTKEGFTFTEVKVL